jgi:hypothetical protein
MTTHRAMKDLASDGSAVRALARSLLMNAQEWTDWEIDFLESMATRDDPEPLSMRQREVLVDLRSKAERHATVNGFAVPNLIERTWAERFDLDDEEDQVFIEALRTSGARTVTGRQRGRLLRIARLLGVIEPHHVYAD